jgi:GT2 family glycosyltransferase/glycosyltransferase involved in cell wall biosynthesis
VPPVSDLSSDIAVVFASGTAELNAAMVEDYSALARLVVVAEFEPSKGEWIPWHPFRSLNENLTSVQSALGQRRIVAAAVAYDNRSALGDLRRAARMLAGKRLVAYDEEMQVTTPVRHAFREVRKQLSEGGRVHTWLRRIVHPAEAEIPIRARLAQAKGVAAGRSRRAVAPQSGPAPANLSPGVTIVIPSRDGKDLLAEMLPRVGQHEIIVVDNGSSDGTAEWLALEHPSIRVIQHAAPLSFARAVNKGIHESRTTHTLLLNNDMIAEPGFVEALQAAFGRVPDLFCATAQITFPEGVRREETGKAVWRKVNELDFPVRCDEPYDGEDLTWVLYGSGGCSLFETAKLLAIGGVAEIYDPAYVEDMDFGFRAWKRGWPSVYCANARVEHRHRSTTSRFYSEREIDFFTERNYLRFVSNVVTEEFEPLWVQAIRRLQLQAMNGRGAALDTLRNIPAINSAPPATTGHLSEGEILSLTNGDAAIFPGKKALTEKPTVIASPYLPFPLSHGGAVRIYNLMRLSADRNDLVLIAFVDELAPPPAELLAICTQIVLVRRHGTHYKRTTPRPDTVEEFDSDTFRACLKQAVHQWKTAIVQLEFTWMAQYADACKPAKTILVEHDITFDLQQQLLATKPSLEQEQQLAKWKTFETEAWRNVDCVVAMSAKDTAAVTGAREVRCIPNGVDCERFKPTQNEPEPNRLLMIGSFAHLPNLLALEFFLREVWPLLGPGYKLHVIGGARHEYYLDFFRDRVSLDLSQVEVDGFVSDVRGAYNRASIVLATLTASAGTNIKVLEAMAMGKVVVATSAGVNGLDVTPGHDVLIGETGAELAALIRNTANHSSIGRNARETALRYDWRRIAQMQVQ